MAKPIERTFESGKHQIIKQLSDAVKNGGMDLVGCNKRRGIISFRSGSGALIYAHIVEKDDKITRVSLAPGLSNLENRRQSEVPESTIKRLLEKLENAI